MIHGFKIVRIKLFFPELKKIAVVAIVLFMGEPSDVGQYVNRVHTKKKHFTVLLRSFATEHKWEK